MPREQLVAKLEALALPFAPIARPDELSDDPHLLQSGGLVEVTIAGDEKTLLPGLPIEIDGQRMHPRHDIPTIGQDAADRPEEHTSELQSLMRISYAVFCLKKKTKNQQKH